MITANTTSPPSTALTPADIQSAYHLPTGGSGSGRTVAIIDWGDDANAEADLATFRAQYGLPACTTANGCFTKVNQQGQQGNYPPDQGAGVEISLDVDAVSAACPACKILLVEASSNSFDDIGAAVNEAVSLGAKFVSNSYGTVSFGHEVEAPTDSLYDHYYDHPGVAVVASAGDEGWGVGYPAADPNIVSAGGTRLTRDSSTPRGWSETTWGSGNVGPGQGTGSGCSQYEPQPSVQGGIDALTTACPANRAVADISADADPASGLAVYDTNRADGVGGWVQVGGTSLSSPLLAAMYALAGDPAPNTYPVTYPYQNQSALNDISTGSNGRCGTVLCNGAAGWDGPTGLGTPNGVDALKGAPEGTITGQVTAADTGKPVAGVKVSTGTFGAVTDAEGHYTLTGIFAGNHQITTGGTFEYDPGTSAVNVIADQSVTQNFALKHSPTNTVSGTITDGSGHGWPLYAAVTAEDHAGHTATAFTDPSTGKYNLPLHANNTYTVRIAAVYPGYQTLAKAITVGTSDITQDAKLLIDPAACDAPGYIATNGSGRSEAFDTSKAPKGWQVANTNLNYPGYTETGWAFNNPGGRKNSTGGTGNFAIVDSDHAGKLHYQDTTLTSPVTSLAKATTPVLSFDSDLQPAVNSTATVDLSTDGGSTWKNIWIKKSFPGDKGPTTVRIALPQAAGKADIKVRFGYTGSWSQFWEIDNLFLGQRTCAAAAGGLVVGQVNDTTGAGVTGATVASVANPAQSAVTVTTPNDPNLGDGLYWLFTTGTGTQQFTAAATGRTSSSESTTVTNDKVSTLNFTLASAPGGATAHHAGS